jgi:uncharacterized protein
MIFSMASRLLIDTWGWLTLNDAGERRHSEVATFYRTLLAQKALIYTTTFILDETFTLFFKRLNPYQAQQAMLQLSAAFSTEQLQLIQIDEPRFTQAQTLRLKYLDKPQISFTDLTSMVVMREFNIEQTLTEDAHFIQVGLGFERVP